ACVDAAPAAERHACAYDHQSRRRRHTDPLDQARREARSRFLRGHTSELAAMAKVLRDAAVAAAAALAGAALADDSGSDRNRFQFEIDASYVHADSPLGAWTDGGLGKLRYAETNDGLESTRVFGQYRGRIANTLSATVIADYQSDASSGIDVTEAYMDWRPVPKSENQQQIRFGAFYP